MSSEIGEIKAGIVLTALLEHFSEIFVSRYCSREGEVKYQVEGSLGPLCAFRVEGDKVIFSPESSFGNKEKEVKELIARRVGRVEYTPRQLEVQEAEEELKPLNEPVFSRGAHVSEPPEPVVSVIPSTPGIADGLDAAPGTVLDVEGVDFQMATNQQPIPSTSYMASLGKFQNNWAVAITRGKKVIGVEKIPSLDSNIIIGAIQKIIVIPLFSPYAVSRAVGRLLEEVKAKG